MKLYVLGLISLMSVFCLRAPLNNHYQEEQEEDYKIGGYEQRSPNKQDEEIDRFIKKQLPELNNAQLTSVQVQVVNGWNYKFKYTKDQKAWVVTVYEGIDQSTPELMGITKIQKIKDQNGNIQQVSKSLDKQDQGVTELGLNLFQN